MPRKKVSVEPVEKIWLSTKEFAKYIGMSTGYIHDLRRSGQIHHYMIGNTAFFKKSDVDELIEGHKVCLCPRIEYFNIFHIYLNLPVRVLLH